MKPSTFADWNNVVKMLILFNLIWIKQSYEFPGIIFADLYNILDVMWKDKKTSGKKNWLSYEIAEQNRSYHFLTMWEGSAYHKT